MSAISVQDAVTKAKSSLLELFSDDPPKALALEGIELIEESGRELWSVTLGFHRPKSVSTVGPSRSSAFMFPEPPSQVEHRVYKTVFIDASSGQFVKMDMRLVQ